MVIVSDLDNDTHAEINVVEGVPKAARLVETLLEAGFDQSRIRVFVGGEMGMHVRQRPTVTIVGSDRSSKPALDDDVAKFAVMSENGTDPPMQETVAEPYQQNGVRFSAAFRPA